jgi:hypothetical protein
MIIRAALTGIVLWFAAMAAFRFVGAAFFYPDETLLVSLFIGAPVLMAALSWALMRLLGVARGDEAEAAIAMALPGMIFSVYVTSEFSTLFPLLDPVLDAAFGALMLEAYAAMLFTGILFTRLAPQDERL